MTPAQLAGLTEDHFFQLKNARDIAAQMQQRIDLARAAGLDVTQQQKMHDQIASQLKGILDVYYPGRV